MDDKEKPKLVDMIEDSDGYDEHGVKIIRISYSCPTCEKGYLVPFIDRCPNCNQALKW
jgi:hypothetical protein